MQVHWSSYLTVVAADSMRSQWPLCATSVVDSAVMLPHDARTT